ncbi:3-oxoacyl-ACP synthase III family protein [Microbispora hainanensis]|uniref:3-oxoacyl-ACP synthase III family protein n=1 Tax=Microbispora hainanensis TaxID=568844 RepID=A0ABZ1SK15_9ACTN|nr:3-oxoacyl-ACP synthase III family protein [Microbispora hainanensis]
MTPLQRGEAASLGVIGTAAFLPGAPVGNAEIAGRSGASLDWISERTGVMTRHIAMPDERTSDLAAAAGQLAMADTQVRPDMLVLATVTADQPVPATACVVQDRLGIRGTPAVDVNAACSGFIYALVSAWGASCVGVARSPLVIGADAFTRFVDPTDRRTAPLFGDGAGAVMLGPVPQGYGILAADLWADGSRADLAVVPPPSGLVSADPWFRMDGRAVRQVVMEMGPKILQSSLDSAGIKLEQLDRIIVHQANPRLVEALAESMGLDEHVVPRHGVHTGNIASASIPVSLAISNKERPFARGAYVALVAIGAGMTAGSVILRWY